MFSLQVIIVSILFFMVGTIEFGLAMSFPSVIGELGFNGMKAQLLGVGPFIPGLYSLWFRGNYPQNFALMVPFESSNNKGGLHIRQAPNERCHDSSTCHRGSCRTHNFLW
jgi:hypothetical protein